MLTLVLRVGAVRCSRRLLRHHLLLLHTLLHPLSPPPLVTPVHVNRRRILWAPGRNTSQPECKAAAGCLTVRLVWTSGRPPLAGWAVRTPTPVLCWQCTWTCGQISMLCASSVAWWDSLRRRGYGCRHRKGGRRASTAMLVEGSPRALGSSDLTANAVSGSCWADKRYC
jgi:hypothetical protein